MDEPNTFDRDEAFRIFLSLLEATGGQNANIALDTSIRLAQAFEARMDEYHDAATLPPHKPIESVGRFYTHDNSLCIEAGDGSRCFKSEFADSQHALDWAIALNSLFKVEA